MTFWPSAVMAATWSLPPSLTCSQHAESGCGLGQSSHSLQSAGLQLLGLCVARQRHGDEASRGGPGRTSSYRTTCTPLEMTSSPASSMAASARIFWSSVRLITRVMGRPLLTAGW